MTTPTKCTECQFEEGHSLGCSKYSQSDFFATPTKGTEHEKCPVKGCKNVILEGHNTCTKAPQEEARGVREWLKMNLPHLEARTNSVTHGKLISFIEAEVYEAVQVERKIWFEAEKKLREAFDSKDVDARTALIDELKKEIEGMKRDEIIILDCENCGEEGYGKAWFGKGEPTNDAWGDRYRPTGSVVYCKECAPQFEIGRVWNGEEIWKKTSDDEKHTEVRLNSIRVRSKENTARNSTISDILTLLTKLRGK